MLDEHSISKHNPELMESVSSVSGARHEDIFARHLTLRNLGKNQKNVSIDRTVPMSQMNQPVSPSSEICTFNKYFHSKFVSSFSLNLKGEVFLAIFTEFSDNYLIE